MNNKENTFKYEDLYIGQIESFDEEITKDLIENFAKISGDYSPIHMDSAYAEKTQFGKRIAHGMISGMWFSRLVGMHIPGKYAVYLSQNLNFHKPFLIGEKIQIVGEIIQKIDVVKTIKLKTIVKNKESNEVMVSGEALVKVLS